MAGLPQLFRAHSRVPSKNPIAADIIVFGIISGDFPFCIDIGMLCAEAILMRTLHTFMLKKIEEIYLLYLWTWCYD